MVKVPYNIYIDSSIKELLLLRAKKDPDFTASHFIEEMLRDFFAEDLKSCNIEKEKIDQELRDMEQKMTLLKLQKKEMEKIAEDKKQQWYKERGYEPVRYID